MHNRLLAAAGAAVVFLLAPGLAPVFPLSAVTPAAAGNDGPSRAQPRDPYPGRSGQVSLVGDVLNHLGELTPTGPYEPAASLSIGISLTRPDPAGENAYLADVYDPRSHNFRNFLDVSGFEQRFGVPAARYRATLAWLRSHGLTVTTVAGSSEYVIATGPASAIESMLGVTINRYTAGSRAFYANAAAPTVPAALGILGISGLEDWSRMRTMKDWQHDLPASPQHTAAPAAVNTGSTTPQDLWGIYHQPANNTGQGESMAIFGWGSVQENKQDVIGNLRAFEKTYRLPQIPVKVDHYGPASEAITDTSGTGEWTLDLPASSGMAPGAEFIHMYFGKSGADPDILGAYAAWNADAAGPRQGSSSFAGCEASPATGSLPGGPGNPPTGPGATAIGNPNQDSYEALLKATVALGRTMFVSTGDLGAQGCPYSFTTALNGITPVPTGINNYPSDSQFVTAVGGTVLYWNSATATAPASRFFEYSWTHTGGGTSLHISAPPFQLKNLPAPGLLFPCVVDSHNPPNSYAPGTVCRGIPDVAAQSGDVITNGYVAGTGTSLSSPLWLGMWTRIQAASNRPNRLGFASEAIYTNNADATRWANDFFDIGGVSTQTAASCAIAPTPYSCSHPGWDYLSGWGTPDVTNLMKDLNGGNTAPTAAGSTPPAAAQPPTNTNPLPNTGSQPPFSVLAGLTVLVLLGGAGTFVTMRIWLALRNQRQRRQVL